MAIVRIRDEIETEVRESILMKVRLTLVQTDAKSCSIYKLREKVRESVDLKKSRGIL